MATREPGDDRSTFSFETSIWRIVSDESTASRGAISSGWAPLGRCSWDRVRPLARLRRARRRPCPVGPIVKPLPPDWFIHLGTNAEMRWEAMLGQGYQTPSERFFVRNHISTPLIDPQTWRLRVFGSGAAREGAGAPPWPQPPARVGCDGPGVGWPPEPGGYELLARATDRTSTARSRRPSPSTTGGYQFWAVVPPSRHRRGLSGGDTTVNSSREGQWLCRSTISARSRAHSPRTRHRGPRRFEHDADRRIFHKPLDGDEATVRADLLDARPRHRPA